MKPSLTRVAPAFHCPSPETGTTYPIYVDAPDPRRAPGPWPVVLLMDGDFFFDTAVEVSRALQAENRIPPLLLAAVGYGAGFGESGNHRGRDYTPTRSDLEPTSGGAEAFIRFLTTTLWPDLARRFPVREDNRTIAGYSLGALVGLHALFESQPRPFFDRVLAGAPSIWWDDRALLTHAARCRDRQAALPAALFLAVGTADTESMTGDLALFEQQLAARPFSGLQVFSERFPGRDHYNAAADCLRAGLPILCPPPTPALT
jgi:predicted alpha/beta superfamily hydrolase